MRLQRLVSAMTLTLIAFSLSPSIVTSASPTGQQVIASQPNAGVRHRIDVSVQSEPAAAKAETDVSGRDVQRQDGSIMITFSISDEARESRFFGQIRTRFTVRVPDMGPSNQIVWQDSICHQRRGLPKVEIISIDGTLGNGSRTTAVSARPRQLGLRLPPDEIVQGIKWPGGVDEIGRFLAYQAKTKRSHLLVDMKIYAIDCTLTAEISDHEHI